jgi:hypothetical protein
MQERYTAESRRNKLSTSEADGTALGDPLDIDRFLVLGPYYFYDPGLDGLPRRADVERLVKLGLPPSLLINQGTANEASALLAARRERGLASIGQARLLRRAGHPRPWSIRWLDVPGELGRLRKQKKE